MHPKKIAMLWINVVGGVAVLGSYVYGLISHPGSGAVLWGGAPENIRPLYVAGMLLAALGYFAFTYYLFFRLDPVETRVGNRFGFGIFNWLYLGILAPSALWMPLTWIMIERPGEAVWIGIRIVLVIVGLASLGLVLALMKVRPKTSGWAYWLAILGSVLFCAHTGILDALVWPALFPR